MSAYQKRMIDELKRKQKEAKDKGQDSQGLRDKIAELEQLYEADEAARAKREAAQKAERDTRAKAREEAEDARIEAIVKGRFMAQPGASEAEFKRAFPWLKKMHIERETQEAATRRRSELAAQWNALGPID